MARITDTLRHWMRGWHEPATYLGAVMIAAIWLTANFNLAIDRSRLELGAQKNSSNLARVFEEHIVRTLRETDRTLLLLREAYLGGSSTFDLATWLANPALRGDVIVNISIVGIDGEVIDSSFESKAARFNVRDRAYFQFQRDSASDELFVGEPTIGRIVGRQVILISRGIRDTGGSFMGAIVASIDSKYLANFYESIDVGNDGAIVLVGLDGIIRASAGFKNDVVGNSLKHSQLFEKIKVSDTGTFLTTGNLDTVRRLVSYRTIKGYPLVVYAGEAENEVLASYWRNQTLYYTIAVIATSMIAIVVVFSARYRSRMGVAQAALQESEARARNKSHELEVTLEHMNQGIVMVNANRDVVVLNRRVLELLGLPKELLHRKFKIDEALSLMWEAGEYGKEGKNIDPKIREMIVAGAMSAHLPLYERTRPDGVTLEVRAVALPDGGIVRTFTDVTERKKKELQIEHMAHHDVLTGLANRALTNERLEQSLARMRRLDERFALLYLDLDRFKTVNDERGHAMGDALLRAIAGRLSDCVRETDTVARLGGDEFVIILTSTPKKKDVEAFAKKVLASISAPYDLDGYRAIIGLSIGIAMAPDDGVTGAELLKNADTALYRAKSGGGGALQFFGQSPPLHAVAEKTPSIVPWA